MIVKSFRNGREISLSKDQWAVLVKAGLAHKFKVISSDTEVSILPPTMPSEVKVYVTRRDKPDLTKKKKDELINIAEGLGVKVKPSMLKSDIINLIEAEWMKS